MVLGGLYVSVLFLGIVGVEVYQGTVFVCLVVFYECAVFFVGVILAVGIFQEGEFVCLVVEIFLRQHPVVDE